MVRRSRKRRFDTPGREEATVGGEATEPKRPRAQPQTKLGNVMEGGKTLGGNERYLKPSGQYYIKCDYCPKEDNVKSMHGHVKAKHREEHKEVIEERKRQKEQEQALVGQEVKKERVKCEEKEIKLEPGDYIEMEIKGRTEQVLIVGRLDKKEHYNYFRLEDMKTRELKANLERNKWKKIKKRDTGSDHTDFVLMNLIPREEHGSPEVRAAKQKEIEKLIEWKTFVMVPDEGQFRVSMTWVVWNKPGEGVRARMVARGFEEDNDMPKDSPTADRASIRLIVLIAVTMGWLIMSNDVRSAFLQGEELDRTVHLQPPKEMEGARKKLLLLRTCIYGLNDASMMWWKKLTKEIKKLGCEQSRLDPAVYFRRDKNGFLDGILCSHVDDILSAGTRSFEKEVVLKLKKIFKMGETQSRKFTYTGLEMEQTREGVRITQNGFIKDKIESSEILFEREEEGSKPLNKEQNRLLKRIAGWIGWLAAGPRPDLSFPRVEISTRFNKATVADLNLAVKTMKRIAGEKNEHFIPRNIGTPDTWTIELSTDGSLANLGVNSTRGSVVCVRGKDGDLTPIIWTCNKIQKVCTSSMGAEVISAEKGLGEALYVKELIKEVLGREVKGMKLELLTDNKSLVDNIASNKKIEDKKMILNLAVLKQGIEEEDIDRIKWIAKSGMLADVLTKKQADSSKLLYVMEKGRRREKVREKTLKEEEENSD